MLCERCGSINIVRSRSSSLDRVVRFFTGKKRFFCNRCGWTALRAWDETKRPPWQQPRPVDQDQVSQIEFDIDRHH